MFDKKGLIVVDGDGLDEDTVMMTALEAGFASAAPFLFLILAHLLCPDTCLSSEID